MADPSLDAGLSPDALYRPAALVPFPDEPPDGIAPLFGQGRAEEALRVGVGMSAPGYNVFALGPSETDRSTLVRRLLEQEAEQKAPPADWCYVFNFEQPQAPRALRLPAGQGPALQADMEQFVDDLQTGLAAAFESEEYQTRRQLVVEAFQEEHQQALSSLHDKAEEHGLAFLHTPTGFLFAPLRDGQVLSPDEISALPEEEQARLQAAVETLQEELLHILRGVPGRQRQMSEQLRDLNRDVARYAVEDLIGNLRTRYSSHAAIQSYLDAVEADIVKNITDLLPQVLGQPAGPEPSLRGGLRRYTVNSLVTHETGDGAPVVYEDRPSLRQLVGRTEHRIEDGVLTTDFTLIRGGALHRANGGYLMLDARRVLQQPFAWEALKRILRAGEIRIQSPYEEVGLVSTVSLEPEPIPLDVKVVLVGDRWLYYKLQALDPEFDELFRVEADFEDEIDRTDDAEQQYAQLVRRLAHRADLRPLQPHALARLVEHSARLAGRAKKLSMEIDTMREITREADFWAGEHGRDTIEQADVDRALEARRTRAGRLRERTHEHILEDTLFIDTTGTEVGQINGLSVLEVGRDTFGRPHRITARVHIGTGTVVDIEREVELGGPIHSKGVMILSGFLGARYATEHPLSLTASLVFEQSYGGVEGDSASSAELYALLSAIAEVPLTQSLAVTGSVNQHGEVQPIGGVNEKIEGFFDVCAARGLSGEHGVLIPRANTDDLMLRPPVRDAVRAEEFHVYPVETIDAGMERLTGRAMGKRRDDGTYPPGSINERVASRLEHFAEERAEFQMRANGQETPVS